jgi:PHS family inorganic phosphate transporter-like MFS transporter
MKIPAFLVLLLHNQAFRTFLTGAGFFSDSYDLFITDGVTSMLRALGPVQRVVYTYQPAGGNATATLTSYFTAYCTQGEACLPSIYAGGAWVPNPNTTWSPALQPRYQQQTTELKNGVSNAALIGSVLGQLSFGFAGDQLGRKWCFFLTNCLIIVGCLGSACASAGARVGGALNAAGAWGDAFAAPASLREDVYTQLALWRFILGFGVGGEYPLAATIASEGAKDTAARGKSVLYTFSMQGWGKLSAALVNYALVNNLAYFGGAWELDSAWRFALALGCLLNVVTLPFRYLMEESEIFLERSGKAAGGGGGEGEAAEAAKPDAAAAAAALAVVGQVNPLKGGGTYAPSGASGSVEDWLGAAAALPPAKAAPALLLLPPPPPPPPLPAWAAPFLSRAAWTTLAMLHQHRWTLLGTAGTWFLIDVTFYGQSLMNTAVVGEAVSSTSGLNAMQKLRSSLLSTVWIMLIAIPGYWVAIFSVDWLGRKPLQIAGFVACAVIFALLGLAYDTPLRTGAAGGGFVLFYGLTYFFSNAGPNSVTFLMPAEVFPTLVRATAHGISAASGKVGATVGAFGLLELYSAFCVSQLDAGGRPNCQGSSSPTEAMLAEMSRGVVAVMLTCSGVAALGAVVTHYFCKESGNLSLKEVDEAAGQ